MRKETFSKVDYLAEFQTFVQATLGEQEEILAELEEICK